MMLRYIRRLQTGSGPIQYRAEALLVRLPELKEANNSFAADFGWQAFPNTPKKGMK